MYREYFFDDVETILESDTEIPESVDERIQEIYKKLKLKKDTRVQKTMGKIISREKGADKTGDWSIQKQKW